MDCAAASQCSIDVSDIFFDETFTAQPADGFEFVGWRRQHRGLCGGRQEPCQLVSGDAEGNPILMAFLESPEEVFTLEPEFRSEGFNSLFIGHSFFRPFAEGMPFHTEQTGITAHSQHIVFSGGASGAPQALWERESKRVQIQDILDAGNVELFAMTYHPDYPTTEGYENWIEYALERNPGVRIAIALPWLTQPSDFDDATYEAVWTAFRTGEFQTGINFLRRKYPDTEIFSIPYGQAAIELRHLFTAGELDDVEAMRIRNGDGIFRDPLGHADDILVELGRLVWISAIYGIDLTTYAYEPPYQADLKSIAAKILAEQDPAFKAPYF